MRLFYRITLLLSAALLLRACCVEVVRVNDNVLAPTLKSGDLVLVNKLAYGIRVAGAGNYIVNWSDPKVGDLVMTSEWSDPPLSVIRVVRNLPKTELAPKLMSKFMLRAGEYALGSPQADDTELYNHGLARLRNISGRASLILFPQEKQVNSWWGRWWRPIL